MMTEKLYLDRMELREFDAHVVSAEGPELVLDRTAFYPAGGGQPSDTGNVAVGGRQYTVVDVKRSGDDVVHVLDRDFEEQGGTEVHGTIDWGRRYSAMRFHSAMHLIDGVIRAHFHSSGMCTGGQIYTDHARIDFDFEGMNREKALEIIEKANEVASEGHEILIKYIPQAEALENPELVRTEPGRELISRLKTVRVVDIAGVDMQADGGTHVKNTKEIGRLQLTDFKNNGKRNKRVIVAFC